MRGRVGMTLDLFKQRSGSHPHQLPRASLGINNTELTTSGTETNLSGKATTMTKMILTFVVAAIVMTSLCHGALELSTKEPVSEQGQKLLKYVDSTSAQCQYTVRLCLRQSLTISSLLNDQKLCPAFQYNTTSENVLNCLVNIGECSQEEYNGMYSIACGGAASVLASLVTIALCTVFHFVK